MLGISRLKSILPYSLNLKKRFTPKLTFKTWLFFVTSLFIIGIGIYLLQQSKGAKAAWFDDEYTYRQRIPISNSGSAQTDFQVGITLNTSALVSAGKMQSDCDDLRVVSEDGEALPYWIQEQTGACNTTTTRIWTKVPSIPTTDTNIYIYYGNPVATNSQKPDQVFLFFDDFNGTALNTGKWGTLTHASGTGASYNILGGTINFTTTTAGGYYWLHSKNQIPSAYWMEANVRNNYATNGNVLRIGQTKDTQIVGGNIFPNYSMDDAGNSTMRIVGDTTTGGFLVTSVANGTTSGIWRFGWLATSSQQAFLNDTSILVGTNNTTPIGNSYVYAGAPTNATFGTVTMDWIFARKYAATAPTIGAFGSEELTRGPIAYWKFDEGTNNTCIGGSTDACDSTQNGWDLDMSGGPPIWQSPDRCVSGSCIYFDGSGDFLANANSPDLTTQFTMSAWVKSSNFATQMYVMEVEFGEPLLYIQSNRFFASLRNSANTAWVTYDVGEAVLVNNEWNHIAVTYDTNDDIKFYHNGVLIKGSDTHPGQIGGWTSSSNTWIGGRSGVWFNGFIDEPKIYGYARSAEEIKADFIKGASSKGSSTVLGTNDQSFLSEGLVGYWKMDESTWVGSNAVLDSSGNLNSGTAVGGAGITSPGKFGNGGFFDGANDSVSITDNDLFSVNTTNELTVSGWMKLNALAARQEPISKGTTGQYEWSIRVDTTGFIQAILFDSTGNAYMSAQSVAGLITAGNWYNVTLVANINKPELTMYVNGLAVATTTSTSGSYTNGTASLRFGERADGVNDINGILDEVRIYNRALSPNEVSKLYQWAPGPVAYWDFNENTSTTANDKSGNGFTGTITGADWVPGKYGSALKFNGVDYVNITSPSFPGIAGQITLSMWINGDASIQPQNDSVFEGIGVGNSRVLNAHLPWGSSLVYWDAGNGTPSYDRISKTAVPVEFEGVWNHWAFTKNTSTGSMKIYLNGALWHSGVGNTSPIGTVTNFKIGSYADGTTNYDGLIDDFKIYNYERTPKQIVEDMNANHPAIGSPVGSPVAYWKLDEGYGSTAYSGGNAGSTLNGTFGSGTSAPTWTNNGKFGKALSFDGSSDYYTAIGGTVLYAPDEFTVSVWANPTKYTGNSQQQGFMVSKGIFPNYNYRLITDASSGNKFEVGVQVGSTGFLSLSTKNTFLTGTWYNVIGSYDGNRLKIYVNGELDNNVAIGGTLNTNTTALYVGKYSNGVGYEYKGLLDEIKVYNYGLSDEEIKVEYNQGKAIVLGAVSTGLGGTTPSDAMSRSYCPPGDATTCNSPVAEWLFNENVGTTTYDTSENSRNGSFGTGNSMPQWGVGIQGPAAQFDGSGDLIDTSTELSFSSATSYSVSGWLKPTIMTGGGRYALDRTTASNELISVGSTGSSFFYQIRGDDGVGLISNTVPNIFTSGQWTFFTVVRNVTPDTITTYINGQPKASVTDTTTGTNSPTVRIGNHSTADRGWGGLIDQVRFYDYARSQGQIMWEYNKGAPVAWYKIDECEGTTIYNSAPTFNDTQAGYNGTLTLGASGVTSAGTCATSGAWANGATGKRQASLGFDGSSDYISITDANSSPLDFTTQMSMMAWVKSNVSSTTKYQIFIEKGEPDEYEFYIRQPTGKFAMEIGNNICDSNITPVVGRWYHAAATWDGTTAKVYINGKLDATCAISYTMTPDNSNLTIGYNPDTTDDHFYGQIDDVRLFGYPLSIDQIRAVYNNGAVYFE